jgi:hypothetical protein
MLLGEYNYTANFIRNDNANHLRSYNQTTNFIRTEDSSWWAKLVFITFVFDMSVVLMNLILGLAVSDIDALQRSSEVKRMGNEFCIVKAMEEIIYFICKMLPFLDR